MPSRILAGRIAAFAALALLTASCGKPTYPKGRVAESLVELCQREHGLQVRAQMVNTTLGVMAPIPGLVEALRRSAGSSSAVQMPGIFVEGRYAEQTFDFRVFARGQFARVPKKPEEDEGKPKEPEEPLKKLQQVSTALHRVSLSSDAPVEFYQLIARDPGPEKLDVIFSGHLMDSKRIQFYAISLAELHARSQFSVRVQPEALAEQTVAAFMRDLRRLPLPKLLSTYTAPTKRFGDLLPQILMAAAEIRGKERVLMDQEWPTRQIDRETVVVLVPLEKTGQPGSLMFWVQIRENAGTLLDIQRLDPATLPESIRPFGPPEKWKESFFLEPLSLPTFLADQIAKRVMTEFQPLEAEAAAEPPKGKKPARKEPALKPATPEEVTRVLAETAAYVIHSYEFSQFREVSVVDALRGTRWVIPSVQLDLFRRRNPPELKPVP